MRRSSAHTHKEACRLPIPLKKRAGEGMGGLGGRENPLARAEGFPFPPTKNRPLPCPLCKRHIGPDIVAGDAGPVEGGQEFPRMGGTGLRQAACQPAQIADNGARGAALSAQSRQRQALMPLGEAFAVAVQQQREMGVPRRRQAQQTQQGQLARR